MYFMYLNKRAVTRLWTMIVHESNILQEHVKCYAAYFDYVKVFEPHSQPIHIAESTPWKSTPRLQKQSRVKSTIHRYWKPLTWNLVLVVLLRHLNFFWREKSMSFLFPTFNHWTQPFVSNRPRQNSYSAARILSPNPTRRPLPCLLIKSFFYGPDRPFFFSIF